MPDYTIRDANADDLPAIQDLLVTTWHHTYDDIYGEDRVNDITARWHSVQALANGLYASDRRFLIAEIEDRIVATAYAGNGDGSEVKLFRLYVHPDCQGTGLGRELLARITAAFPAAEKMTLEVEPQNRNAILFYEKHGFVASGEGDDCGGQGDDIPHLIMTKAI